MKAIVVFLGFHVYYKRYDVKELGYHLKGLAKAIIIAAFICAVISQFGDIGMTMRHADGNIYYYIQIYSLENFQLSPTRSVINSDIHFFTSISCCSIDHLTHLRIIYTKCFSYLVCSLIMQLHICVISAPVQKEKIQCRFP